MLKLTKRRVAGGFLMVMLAVFSGCIRLQAGTWYQGPNDENPKVHEVDLNTQQLLPAKQAPGDITVD